MYLAQNIKYLRKIKGWSQDDLAEMLGIARASIASYEMRNVNPYRTTTSLFPSGFTKSVLNSDCWKTHLKTPAKDHQICIAHLRRECKGLIDFHQSRWASKLDKVLHDIQRACQKPRIATVQKEIIETQIDQLLNQPLKQSVDPIKKLKKRLIRLRNCITICLYNRKVPPDNNASERAIRMIKFTSETVSHLNRIEQTLSQISALATWSSPKASNQSRQGLDSI